MPGKFLALNPTSIERFLFLCQPRGMNWNGDWRRWGRRTKGSTEGWSLEIGRAYRCGVYPTPKSNGATWDASINGGQFGTYATRDDAMAAIEREVQAGIDETNRDWHRFLGARAERTEGGRLPLQAKPRYERGRGVGGLCQRGNRGVWW